jgi:hypothetical protein
MDNGDSYSGGSGTLEDIFNHLLRFVTLNEQGSVPRMFKRGVDIMEHLRKVSDDVKSVGLDTQRTCAFLINTLEKIYHLRKVSHGIRKSFITTNSNLPSD